jgi:hypothetical protein
VAARRLVVVMLVLLAVSTLVTALLPRPDSDKTTPLSTSPDRKPRPQKPPKASETGLDLVARMQAGSKGPKSVRIERGDELRLDVVAPFGADVEIPGFGRTEPVTPFAPAQFDLFATSVGTYPVRVVDPLQLVGQVLVGKPDSGRCGVSTPATPRGRGSTASCRRRERRSSPGHGRSARQP